jgi:hypothetical protein
VSVSETDSAELIYIAGSGRNGSTFLGLQLGRAHEVCFAGELTHIWQRGYLNDELCGCGQTFQRCDFWGEVTRSAFGTFTASDAQQALILRNSISQFRNLPWLLAGRAPVAGNVVAEYGQIYGELVGAIRRHSGCSHVVDSSKYPTDLAALTQLPALGVRVVHLIRDCNAVVYSWKRKKQRTEIHWQQALMPRYGAIQTALGWKLFNRSIQRVMHSSTDRYRQLRYEDLTTQFDSTMNQLFSWLQVSEPPLSEDSAIEKHTIGGNPCRFDFDAQHVRIDEQWRHDMKTLDRLTVRLLCGRDQKRFGYSGPEGA